jgi:DNA-binding response OmpR family regulator
MPLDVLITDQDVELARLYCRFLADNGFSAETATCGLECLRKVRQEDPHVLVLDRELPRGDAVGVLACLREDGLSLPIILTTWNASQETIDRLVVPPVVFCLRKFFPLPELLDGIRFAVGRQGIHRDLYRQFELAQKEHPTWSANEYR